MRIAVLAFLTLLTFLMPNSLGSQTLLGNCGADITGIQLSTGNIYCIPAPVTCSNSFDFSETCNSQFLALVMLVQSTQRA